VSEVGPAGPARPRRIPPAPRDDEPPAISEGRPPVRLRAPAGVGAVQLLSGVHRNASADGTVEMTETDAAPLLSAGWVRAWKQELSK
jgi:hypothetical protein